VPPRGPSPPVMGYPCQCLDELYTDVEPITDHSSTATDGWSNLMLACLLRPSVPPWIAPVSPPPTPIPPQIGPPLPHHALALHTDPLSTGPHRFLVGASRNHCLGTTGKRPCAGSKAGEVISLWSPGGGSGQASPCTGSG
jgi:hypothetical protein